MRTTCPGPTPASCGITDPNETCEGCVQKVPYDEVCSYLDSLKDFDLIEVAQAVRTKFNLNKEQIFCVFQDWYLRN